MKSFLYNVLGLFLLCSIALHGKTVQLAPEAEPLALVHGCVSMINGEFVQQKTDLYVEGPSSLTLTRVYGSGLPQIQSTLGHGFTWSVARDLWSVAGPFGNEAALDEREGIHLYYRRISDDELLFKVDPKTFLNGYTNYSPGEISGLNNLHNVTLRAQGCKWQRTWIEDTLL